MYVVRIVHCIMLDYVVACCRLLQSKSPKSETIICDAARKATAISTMTKQAQALWTQILASAARITTNNSRKAYGSCKFIMRCHRAITISDHRQRLGQTLFNNHGVGRRMLSGYDSRASFRSGSSYPQSSASFFSLPSANHYVQPSSIWSFPLFQTPLSLVTTRNNHLHFRMVVGLHMQQSANRPLSTESKQQNKGFYVWEQTVSSAAAMGSTSDIDSIETKIENEEEIMSSGKGGVLYRPAGVSKNKQQNENQSIGWEIVGPPDPSLFSTLPTFIKPYTIKDLTNIQNLPFIHHFLPANYPRSVSPSYLSYATYCFCGSIAGSAAMVLSTQALLVAVGVGTQSAAPMAAALNWVMKDGVGQLGGVIFASQLGKGGMDVEYWKGKFGKWANIGSWVKKRRGSFQRGTADTNPKRWRMVAALALDMSTLLEICTPWMGPEWFLPCASIANVGKNVGFLAASASRAAIHQSLCTGGSAMVPAGGVSDESSKTLSLGNSSGRNSKTDTDITAKKQKVSTATSTGSNLGDGKTLFISICFQSVPFLYVIPIH